MAEVMSDMSGSNGELKEDNDEIRVNGELSEKSPGTIANGHFKSDQIDNNSTVYRDENKVICDIKNDLASHKSQSNEPVVAAVTSSLTIKNVSENADCDSASVSLVQNDDDSADEDEVLNLKTNSVSNKITNSPNGIVKTSEDGLSESNECGDDEKTESRLDDCSNKSETESCENESQVDDSKDDDVVSIENTPDKLIKKNKKPVPVLNVTPRRSSRNLNKQQKSYSEKEAEYEEDNSSTATTTISPVPRKKPSDDDEIEEVTPTDPLADDTKSRIRNKTIVVSDTKGLVEFASNAKASRSNKKEPTLVIIDTNSILSGRGPVPVSQSSSSSLIHSSTGSTPIPVSLPIPAGALANATRGVPASTSAFSVIPLNLPSQGVYSQYKSPPPQIKPILVGPASTSVTPITVPSTNISVTNVQSSTTSVVASAKQPPVILPSLTDDMFVVEAPSFIVPYVYEKPPMRSLKDHIEKLEAEIKEIKEKERLDKEQQEREQKEKAEKSKQEKERIKLEEKEKEVAKQEKASADDAKISDKDDESNEKLEKDTNQSETVTIEKDSDLQMEVEEEGDPNAVKVSSDTDIILASSKKPAEPEKKEEFVPPKEEKKVDDSKKLLSYFDNPLGKFFMQIGLNLVQEHVQTDLLRSQKRKRDKEGDRCSPDVKIAIETLTKTLESSKENNDPFKLELKKCELCSFKTESLLVMAHHLETPHMKNYTYRCNFCPLEVRSPHDILFHMEAEHNIRGRLERAPAFHQCPNCPFEDNQKGKLTRHLVSCSKKYRAERNQEPPLDWEPPAKIPRVTRNRPPSMSPGNAVYQAAMSGLKQVPQNSLLPKLMPNATNMKHNMMNVNKRPSLVNQNFVNRYPTATTQPNFQQRPISVQSANQGLMYRAPGTNAQTQVLIPPSYQLSGAQIYQQNQNIKQSQQQQQQHGLATAKLLNQPSISITPLPRQPSTMPSTSGSTVNVGSGSVKPGKPATNPGGKSSFVVCEICDGYIKDLEQLRNHMQWIHKVKIHPKMIYNRPPLNCQKCQFRFFTDQGLERHLLGSHGLVTSSMQEAANKGKDSGRCPVCGRVYQWKLLNHVARDHQMALKPAHLSYKCTVCTATFGMYKQFESHVYSAHSVVAKRAMDTKKPPIVPTQSSSSQNETLLKPLKINDEITIIPQPIRSVKPSNKTGSSTNTAPVISNKGKV